MRGHYGITITSYSGAKHYTVTQLMRQFIAGIGIFLATCFFGGFLAIYLLSYRLEALNSAVAQMQYHQTEIKSKNQSLLNEQQELQATVEEKVAALSMMSDELGSIESMIGLTPAPDTALYQRLDTASQTASEKHFMLTVIPSGYPLAKPFVTSRFGMRNHPVLGRMALHGGADLRAAIDTPVYATADGVVEWAGLNESGFGRMIKLFHNFGFTTLYGHLNKTAVSRGDYVRQGDLIGYSGNTGMSSAPHLHYEIRHLHRRLAPGPFMEWSWENYDVLFTREEKIKWDSMAKALRKQMVAPERQWSQLAPPLPVTSS
jgi:murein DD-endopeptidase MepM/ murein hydrolase activator NlpD